MLRSLRWRLTGWYVLLLTIILLIFSAGTYLAVEKVLRQNVDDALVQQATLIGQLIRVSDREPVLAGEVRLAGRSVSEYFTRLYRRDGSLVFEHNAVEQYAPEVPDEVSGALKGRKEITQVTAREGQMRIVTFPVLQDGQIVGALQVGVDMEDIARTMRTLLEVLLVMVPTMLLLASGGGWFLAHKALTPIDAITRTAQQISAEHLSGRIGHTGPNDEVGRLGQTFDAMLARLEAAFIRQRQFTADASHELRTPLTAIIGQLDVAIARERHPDEDGTTFRVLHTHAQRLARLVSDLLFLARTDAQFDVGAVEPIDLGVLIPAIVGQIEPLAAARQQKIVLAPLPALVVNGNEDRLIRIVLNLLDNAIRYTPQGGTISLSCMCVDGTIAIGVSDTGPGIAAEHVPRLFDRFYRIDRGRSRSQGGSGLGLAIAQSLAQVHGGRITVESTV